MQLSDAKALLPLKLRVVFNTILFARERITEMLRQVEGLLQLSTKNQNAFVGGFVFPLSLSPLSLRPPVSAQCIDERELACSRNDPADQLQEGAA